MSMIVFYIGTLLAIIVTSILFYKWWSICHPKLNGVLPPGSMGFPFIGETLQFFTANTSFELSPFIKQKMQRYGPLFKTSLLGVPLIVSTDGDLNYFILQQEGKLFGSWYPNTNIFGREILSSLNGSMHKYFRSMVLSLFGPESLKMMILDMETASNNNLKKWSQKPTVELKDAIAKMIFELTANMLISCDEEFGDKLRSNFLAFIDGLISFPLNIPGTAYYKCMQGRKNVMRMLKSMLQERRERPRSIQTDFFDYMLEELAKEDTQLTETMALDFMLVLLFATYETTSLALTFAMKLLAEYPLVLQKLTEEHETILKLREDPDSTITWNEYKSMKFSNQVMFETLRLANIAPIIFRKALTETKVKGYTIPAGWVVMVYPSAVHLDQAKYKNPLEFDPWRWEGIETSIVSRNFMAFGGGMRICIGAEFAKVQMAVFLHCLVTKWKAVKGGEIVRNPGLKFPNGFHVQITETKKDKDTSTK